MADVLQLPVSRGYWAKLVNGYDSGDERFEAAQ